MKCVKCDRDVSNAKDVIKCAECGSLSHVACCRVRSMAKLTAMSSRAVAEWKCDDCKLDTASQASLRSETEDTKMTEILLSIQKEISSSQAANKEGFRNLESKLSCMQTSLDTLNKKVTAVEAENVALKAECSELREMNTHLSKRANEFELQLIEMQQYSRNRNIEVRGLPETKHEDVYLILESVAKALGVPYERQAISIAHRLPAQRGKPKESSSLIAQFVSRSTRADWLMAAKRKRISTTDLSPSLRPGPIFIVDHLAPHNRQLLGHARSLVRDGRLAFAWSRDGKIMVRTAPESPARRIRTMGELEEVIQPRCVGDSAGGIRHN